MKITAVPNDPNYWRNHFVTCPMILLNDMSIDHVTEADDVEGYVIIAEYDANGRPVSTPDGKSISHRRLVGAVQIVGDRQL